MVGIMTASLACSSSRKWENLKTLVVDPTTRERYNDKLVPILEATSPHKPFGTTDVVANTLALATLHQKDPEEALKDLSERRQGGYRTPAAEWLHSILGPLFLGQWHDRDAYDSEFDRAEVMLGILAQDVANVRASVSPDGRAWTRSHWYGRATWRAVHYHGNAAEHTAEELAGQGKLWGPLQAGLFGADEDRAKAAMDAYVASFDKIAQGQRF
jgi:hypothetical protein